MRYLVPGLLLLPLLAFPQEPPATEVKTPQEAPAPRLDLYGDPLPDRAIARLGSLKLRHLGQVLCVAYSPDGKVIATGGEDRCIRLWDAETKKSMRELRADGRVTSLAFSPGGCTIAAGEGSDFLVKEDHAIHIWRVSTGREIDQLGDRKTTSDPSPTPRMGAG